MTIITCNTDWKPLYTETTLKRWILARVANPQVVITKCQVPPPPPPPPLPRQQSHEGQHDIMMATSRSRQKG